MTTGGVERVMMLPDAAGAAGATVVTGWEAAGTVLVAKPTHPARVTAPTKAITDTVIASNLPLLEALL